MRALRFGWAVGVVVLALGACGGDDGGAGSAGMAGGGTGGTGGTGGVGGGSACTANSCDDGIHCNGEEQCDPTHDNADDNGCVAGTAIQCDDDITCTTDRCDEDSDLCLNEGPDDDGDGHAASTCLGADQEPTGDDCDDGDLNRFPGNTETCDAHDEDCDPLTIGTLDADGDGIISDACCNTNDTSPTRCGGDCDDTNLAINNRQVEFCDNLDNDCDGEVDEGATEVPWYADDDGDNFGAGDASAVLSCIPVPGTSLLNTDCDDDDETRHPGQLDICDSVDNNCNDVLDENGGTNCTTTPPDPKLPVNECENGLSNCTGIQICVDLPEGFSCLAPGDACLTNNGGCDTTPTATCSTSTGSVVCTCPSTHTGTGLGDNGCIVIPPDPCLTDNGGCSDLANCTNDSGTVSCACPAYYIGNGVGSDGCTDIDECLSNNGDCGTMLYMTCTNNDGYAPTCTPVDQCGVNNGGCGNALYYACDDSNPGVARTCTAIDQCQDGNNGGCGSDEICINIPGAAPVCDDLVLCTGDYTVSTQAELITLSARGCTRITGSLTITSTDSGSLAGLASIRTIDDDLNIYGAAQLTSLSGLSGLVAVGRDIKIGYWADNAELLDAALTGLRTVGGSVYVASQSKLPSLAGLSGLLRVEGDLQISSNTLLLSTADLTGLQYVGGTLSVAHNTYLSTYSFPALTEVGSLYISGNGDLHALGNMAALRTVKQDIWIHSSPVLGNVNSLNSITSAGRNVEIYSNPELVNLTAVSIGSIGGNLSIYSNPKLASVLGFAALTDVGGDIEIHSNDLLVSLTSFSTLTEVLGHVEIRDNPLLTNIAGFGALATINEYLSIHDNPALAQITGFGSLATVNGSFRIHYNPALVQFNAIDQLAYVGDDLQIEGNLLLNSIAGLRSGTLDFVGNRLMVRINPVLSACEVNMVKAGLSSAGDDLNAANRGCTACTAASCSGTAGGVAGQSTTFGPAEPSADNDFTVTPDARLGLLANVTVIEGDLHVDNTAATTLTGLNNLTSVTGSFTISGNQSLSNLTGLGNLQTIGKGFTIYYNTITTLSALSKLESVGGLFDISSNYNLTNVNGLGALTTTGGLTLADNPLTNVNLLTALTTVDGNLNISSTSALANLNSLAALTTVSGSFTLSNNAGLTSITGLASLTGIGGQLYISGNGALTNLTGLSGITNVGGSAVITSNPELLNVDGLSGLVSIDETLQIYSNAKLADLNGLISTLPGSLTTLGGDLYVYSNAVLSNCAVSALVAGLISWPGTEYSGNNTNLTCGGTCNGAVCP